MGPSAPSTEHARHRVLYSGIELGVLPMPGRSLAAMEIRLFAGYAQEEPACLGAAHVLAEAISKGTQRRGGRALDDAFDEIGATHAAAAGRETITFSCVCLPEFIERAIDLHAEMICTPTFPEDACTTAVELTRQALAALNDDPGELAKKYLHRQAYGEPLGRHPYGEVQTLDGIGRQHVLDHWRRCFRADRVQVAVAGSVDPAVIADRLEAGFNDLDRHQPMNGHAPPTPTPDRPVFRLRFSPGRTHHAQDLEQVQIALCFPGAAATDDDQAVEQVLVGVLSGGMSSRLWTAIRERQGLVYWVGAWNDRPRGAGMLHLGAAATPANAEQTCAAMLREIDQLVDDCSQAEIARAITGLVASTKTHGDTTRAHAVRLANDLFHHGRAVPLEEKLARIQAVTTCDIHRYLETHPRSQISMVTLGPAG